MPWHFLFEAAAVVWIRGRSSNLKGIYYNVIKFAHRYAVQGSDTTMLTIAAALFGQKYIVAFTVIMICD